MSENIHLPEPERFDFPTEAGYEYRVTEGQRKAWDGSPDLSLEGWEEFQEWERFDYTECRYWRRPLVPDREDA